MKRYWAYFKKLLWHKWCVFEEGLDLYVPIWRLIMHDWHKFLPDEFGPYARTFYNADGTDKPYVSGQESEEFMLAWNKHQKRSRHHWQFWLLTWDRGNTEALQMHEADAREMIADWRGAGKSYAKPGEIWTPLETKKWYQDNKNKMILHPLTRIWIEDHL